MNVWVRICAGVFIITFLAAGCQRKSASEQTTIRITNLKTRVEGQSAKPAPELPRTEWRFDTAPSPMPDKLPATYGWEAASGISGLKIENGKLTGKSTDAVPLLHFERTIGLESLDSLHSIEIRCRVSAGANMRIAFDDGAKFDAPTVAGYLRDFPTIFSSTPLLPGDKFQTYSLKPLFDIASRKIKQIALVPVDQAGATFEIESIRLIFREEYLASIPSGVSWQALGGIFHETVVSRSPEQVHVKTRLPLHPWLDLSVGTIENGPVKFRVSVAPEDGSKEAVVLEHTVTRPHRWEPAPVELARYAGQNVALTFSVASDDNGRIGFWGTPVIRNHESAAAQAARGVIVIWADTLRRDHLNAYGYKRITAPNLQRLASEGALFRNCVSQATWTKVASPSLITSLYPATHGVETYTDRLPSSATTLAEVLQDAGFATVDFSSNEFTATFSNFQQGFEELHEDSSLPDHHSSKTARDYMDRLLPWLQAHRDVPFFAFLHAYDAHDPYEPYEPYNKLFTDPAKKKEHELQLDKVRKCIADPLMKAAGAPNRGELLQAGIDPEGFIQVERDWYDGSIRGMDAEVGRLIEFLKTSGLDRKTLVVFAGDHGEEFLDHDRMFHGQSVYGELTNVPLLLWKPGAISPGTVISNTVETIDVMPTILDFCGLKAPAGIQGRSFRALLSGRETSGAEAAVDWNRPAFSEKAATHDNASPAPHDTEAFAVTETRWKLIHNLKHHDGQAEYELFDPQSDPLNKINVAQQHPDVVQRLSRQLDAWHSQASAAKLKPDSAAAATLSQEELERLRSLGYIQ